MFRPTGYLILKRGLFGMWPKWNKLFLECAPSFNVLFLNFVKDREKIDLPYDSRWICNFLSFLIILWVTPSAFHGSTHLHKGVLSCYCELLYLLCGNLLAAPGNKKENVCDEFEICKKKTPEDNCKTQYGNGPTTMFIIFILALDNANR